ncbi:ABC transporter ATP-binding protein [Glaciimonas sp. PAMC28666]|uniref:ABC transporter ATP-binding protein n=1 Tax=Glaciimonas sp. PAMC28666 TaxID=2807626 RepID=UPI0019649D3E|nr:ABC transporter ATP-binding protein [Glaciimonas sp. PAMC28666]QRX81104.1 ABC transporter ATP-binding protein [Glaciimonas sp. PAMC28666]
MTDTIIETRGLTKDFRGFVAVGGIDLKVRKGAIHALIGPNGAGKSTVFNLLTRFLPASGGQIFFKGEDITRRDPALVAQGGMVRSFQISSTFPAFSVRDNVRIALQRPLQVSYQFWRSDKTLAALNERADELLDAVGLTRWRNVRAADLSYGRKRALELATTLALDPEVMLLDEPMAGLGHEDIERIASLIRKVAVGRTVLMVEHNLKVVADLSDTITVLARGKVLAEGPYAVVSANPLVRSAYMGSAHA